MIYWVFDYDNTLYHPDSGILDEIDERIETYIAETLNVDRIRATEVRQKYYKKYGTTIQGLMEHHSVKPKDYFGYIMDIEKVPEFNKHTHDFIKSLKGKKSIFSNGNKTHIMRGLKSLEIEDEFEYIFDIEDFDYISKPSFFPYEYVSERINTTDTVVFVDDSIDNVRTANEFGWKGVLINRYGGDIPEDFTVINHLDDLITMELE